MKEQHAGGNSDSVPDTLVSLETRIALLESQSPPLYAPFTEKNTPRHATDPFASRMYTLATAASFTQTRFVRCRPNYYDTSLESRRAFLNAPHLAHLCKSIVMENTRHVDMTKSEDSSSKDICTSKYICVVTPYVAKIDSDRLRNLVRKRFEELGKEVPSAKMFNYRLVEDCVGVTGFSPNAVTPLGLKTNMPVVIAKQIVELNPAEFWLGGGEVSLKWRVLVREFCEAFKPVVMDFTARTRTFKGDYETDQKKIPTIL